MGLDIKLEAEGFLFKILLCITELGELCVPDCVTMNLVPGGFGASCISEKGKKSHSSGKHVHENYTPLNPIFIC